jgi:predicted SAM-dependent methyltransferase
MVVCSHVLDDVEDDRKALREIHRVLKPSGLALISVPIDESLQRTVEFSECDPESLPIKYFKDDKRKYGRDFHSRLSNVGFLVEEVRSDFCQEATNSGLLLTDILFVATKPSSDPGKRP